MKFENSTYINYLINLSKQNRFSAFLIIVEIYLKVVYNTVKKILIDEILTNEVCIKTFEEAWLTLNEYNNSFPFSIWIKNIAIPLALQKINLKKDISDNEIAPSEHILTELDVEYAISNLPAINRAVFVLHDIDGYSVYEINLFFPDYYEDEIQSILIQSRMNLITLIKL